MNNENVRVRFAPSPTGYLHIGSLRMVVFNYLIARKNNGRMILRIEDTDQKRQVDDAIDKLLSILQWLGMNFDEGPHIGGEYGPYIQSQRKDIYEKYALELIEKGHAYRCFCGEDRLKQMRQEQVREKKAPKYDGRCAELSSEEVKKKLDKKEPFVIRQKMPKEGVTKVKDKLRGGIEFNNQDLDDHVLLKTDKMATYQLASVVDDHLMKISHVVRGEEWIPSLPKNVLLYNALGWQTPEFVHLPLTLNKDGSKLSKRQGDVAVEEYKEKGFLPEALLNFSALLGWHPKGDKEKFDLNEIVGEFKIEDIKVSPAVFDMEKLEYLNGYYIRQKPLKELTEACLPYLKKNIGKASAEHKKEKEFLEQVVAVEKERLKKLSEIAELTEFFFIDIPEYDKELLLWKKLAYEDIKQNLTEIYEVLENIKDEEWSQENIEEKVVGYLKEREKKAGDYLWPARVALTGKKQSPGPFEISSILGKKETLQRIENAIQKL
ncbi:MAG: glutamate--tRNA ligase [Patescibacteria group bacterium]